MALQTCSRNPADNGDGALNLANIKAAIVLAAASGGTLTGIQLEAGAWNVRADSAGIAVLLTTAVNEAAGADVVPGARACTTLTLVGTDSTVGAAYVIANSGALAAGMKVRNLNVNGGRAACRASIVSALYLAPTWAGGQTTVPFGNAQGACVSFAGQNDYPAGEMGALPGGAAGGHGVQFTNCDLYDGLIQQTSINSVKGYKFNSVRTWATALPMAAGHGGDFDAVAYEKPSCFGYALNCSFDAYGSQEALKHENCTDILYDTCTIRNYVSLSQDQADVYASLARIKFKSCTIDACIQASNLTKQFTPGAFTARTDSVTLTLPGATLNSTGTCTGGVFTAADVGRVIATTSDASIAVIRSYIGGGSVDVRVVKAFGSATVNSGTWTVRGRHFRPNLALTLVDPLAGTAWATVGGLVKTTAGNYPFTTANIGQMVGFYSGQGVGCARIDNVTGATGAEVADLTVIDAFASSAVAANAWVLISADINGSGEVAFDACTFTANGMYLCTGAHANQYGTQTLTGNAFSAGGNSVIAPSGTTIVQSGNSNYGLPNKRFARPAADVKGQGAGGLTYYARASGAVADIGSVVTAALAGEEVWVLDGYYVAGNTSTLKNLNCGGKAIAVRAETDYGVLIDLGVGTIAAGPAGIQSSTDVPGSLMRGFVFANAGRAASAGNGCGVNISGGSLKVQKVAVLNAKTANNGPGIKISGGDVTNPPVVEDYLIDGCDSGASSGGALYVSAASGGAPTLRRGRVRNSIGGTLTAGVRLDFAGVVVDGLEVCGNGNGAAVGGVHISKNATLKNLSAAGNVGTTAHDVNQANATVVAGDSWICWSPTNGAIKQLNIATTGSGSITLTASTMRDTITGGGNVAGVSGISYADPLFVDLVGGNLQLDPSSPCRGTGVINPTIYDAFNKIFGRDAATAHKGAWA